MIRLLQHSGAFEPQVPDPKAKENEIADFLDKRAMLVYTGTFLSMDGEVEINDEMIDALAAAHNGRLKRLKKVSGQTEIPLRKSPPVMLDHSRSARDVVGRLVGPLEVGEHIQDDDLRIKALFGTVRILGRENVERVLDGRWSDLSIGADFEAMKMVELTITPFPAAEDAAMLAVGKVPPVNPVSTVKQADGNDPKGGDRHAFASNKVEGACSYCQMAGDTFCSKCFELRCKDCHKKIFGMSAPDNKEAHKEMSMDMDKMKKHLMEGRKMSAEDADKYLSGIDDEDKAKLWKMMEEDEKKLAQDEPAPGGEGKGDETPEHEKKEGPVEKEEEKKEKESKMSAHKEKVTQLAADFRKTRDEVRLAANKVKISTRLSTLKSQAKITPAEIKKINLMELASKSDEVIDATIKTYQDREPVIPVGQFGTVKAVSLSEVGGNKESKIAQLMEEHRQNMPFTAATTTQLKQVKRLSSDGHMPGQMMPKPEMSQDGVGQLDLDMEHQKLCDMMDINPTDAKKKLKELMERVKSHMASMMPKEESTPHVEDYEMMSALVGQVEMMQNQFEQLVSLAQS